MFSAMSFRDDCLYLLDQRLLPHQEEWLACRELEAVALAIETMAVRGAPAIGCAAAFGLALAVRESKAATWGSYAGEFALACARLARTRPTAVNLFAAITAMSSFAEQSFAASAALQTEVYPALLAEATRLFHFDIETCQAIGRHGAEHLTASGRTGLRVLTHCNTGSLATAGYGTALGVIRALHEAGALAHVYVDETRPWLQGARLTAYELQREGIPHTLIVDSAAAQLMRQGVVDCVIVGADRIAANGDTANKIGTYSVAVVAHHHQVPFYIAAPLTTFDPELRDGAGIPIEERPSQEITHMAGRPLAPHGVLTHNPSFDVTPHALIRGIISEHGCHLAPFTETLRRAQAAAEARR